MMIISLLLAIVGSSQAQDSITPKFVPVGQRPASNVVQAGYTQPLPPPAQPIKPVVQKAVQPKRDDFIPQVRRQVVPDDIADLNLRTDLPGAQRLFMRESEANFYERIRQDAKRYPGSNPAIFPTDEPVISRDFYVHPNYPRLDPRTKLPYSPMASLVEPGYVIHHRLLFEQPNFERTGYDFGAAQPFIHLGVFYYDVALLPYHACSTSTSLLEANVGKCLPGDPAPFVIPCERYSVTGLVGQFGAIIGLNYLFP